eukprot:gene21055-27934_t
METDLTIPKALRPKLSQRASKKPLVDPRPMVRPDNYDLVLMRNYIPPANLSPELKGAMDQLAQLTREHQAQAVCSESEEEEDEYGQEGVEGSTNGATPTGGDGSIRRKGRKKKSQWVPQKDDGSKPALYGISKYQGGSSPRLRPAPSGKFKIGQSPETQVHVKTPPTEPNSNSNSNYTEPKAASKASPKASPRFKLSLDQTAGNSGESSKASTARSAPPESGNPSPFAKTQADGDSSTANPMNDVAELLEQISCMDKEDFRPIGLVRTPATKVQRGCKPPATFRVAVKLPTKEAVTHEEMEEMTAEEMQAWVPGAGVLVGWVGG